MENLVDYVFDKLDLSKEKHLKINPKYFRPEELDILKGDNSKIVRELDWSHEYSFESMLDEMIDFAKQKYK